MHDDAIQQLRLFIEKVEKLLSLSLVCSLIERGSGLRISWTKDAGAPEVSLTGPASEQVDALVLTMRLFMQDNDRISVGRVANLLETLPVSEKLKEYFEKNRSHLNHALDSPSMLVVNNDHPSKRDILQTALYGPRVTLRRGIGRGTNHGSGRRWRNRTSISSSMGFSSCFSAR